MLRIVEASQEAVRDFLDREWAAEDALRFGRYEPGMWEERRGTLAAYKDDEVVGVALFAIQAGVGKLNQLIVASNHRGQGVGSALLAEFERICRQAGCHKVTLKIFWRSDPLHFYQRQGYVVEGILRRDLHEVDMCQVAKFLTS
jgi:GNAT superfamily N-acetyltransferase